MEVFLSESGVYKQVVISDIHQISPDSKLFRFSLPSAHQQLGIAIGGCIVIRALIHSEKYPSGKLVKRKYSPTSRNDACGFFEIPIKVYYPSGDYPGGELTTYLDTLKVGDQVEITGPFGKFIYLGNGVCNFVRAGLTKCFTSIGFIAGGTGITPCFQYIQYIIERNEEINVHLIFANKTERDILLRDQLEKLAENKRFHLHYTLSNAEANWGYGVGYINEAMILRHMPEPSDSTAIFFCGPSPMNRMLRELLPRLGFTNSTKF